MCDGAMEIWVVSWVVRCLYDMVLVGKKHLKIMFVWCERLKWPTPGTFMTTPFISSYLSTWFPSCTPRYFGNESLPLCLGWGHSYVRGRHVPPQEAKPGFYQKCIFGYLLNKDAWQIIVAGKEIFNDVLGHVWNKEAWGVWHISFLQWNIVKAFFSERKRNESFQTKRKSIRFLAVFHDSH